LEKQAVSFFPKKKKKPWQLSKFLLAAQIVWHNHRMPKSAGSINLIGSLFIFSSLALIMNVQLAFILLVNGTLCSAILGLM